MHIVLDRTGQKEEACMECYYINIDQQKKEYYI